MSRLRMGTQLVCMFKGKLHERRRRALEVEGPARRVDCQKTRPLTQGRSRASAHSSGNTDTDREDVLNTDVFR